MSLRQKTLRSLFWNLGENFSTQIIQFMTGIYMARLLSPSDYGLMGMLLIFTALSDAIMNGGFSVALIRKKDRSDEDIATVFCFNIVVAFSLYICLALAAPLIASFYKVPILEDLVKIAAIPFVINAFFLVQRTCQTIRMDFKRQAKISIVSAFVKGGIGICLAYKDFGVWSIAWAGVAGALTSCVLYWWHSVWKLRIQFSVQSFRELFGFGSKLMLSGMLDVLGNNLFILVIGKKFAASSLGYYTRANGYAALPPTIFSGVLSRVTLPMLSQIQDENERLSKAYQQLLNLAAFVIFPLMTGLALLAKPLIVLMITDKWLPCVEYMQILCFAFMLNPIHALNLNLLQVKGRSDLFLRLEIIKKIMALILLIILIPYGIRALCWGAVISSFVAWIINAYYTRQLISVGFIRQFRNILPIVGYTMGMTLCIYFLMQNVESYILQLLGGITIGICSYFLIALCFHSRDLSFLITLFIHHGKA